MNGGKNVSPNSWEVPGDPEWLTLENYLIIYGYTWDGTTGESKISKLLAST